jgi:sugar phosphate isomerase/epimerase
MSHRLLSLEPLGVAEVTGADLVDIAADAGFEFVSMFAHSPSPELAADPAVFDATARRQMRTRLAERGVRLLNLECFNLTPDVDVATFDAALACGGDLGATHATAIVWENADRNDALTKFRRLCDMAAEHEINVNLEFFAMCETISNLDTAAAFVTEAGRANAGIVLDLLHIVRTSGGMAGLTGFDPTLIGMVQISDGFLNSGADPHTESLERLMPGEGDFPLREFLAWLPDDRVLGVEVPQMSLIGSVAPAERARRMVEATRMLLRDDLPA